MLTLFSFWTWRDFRGKLLVLLVLPFAIEDSGTFTVDLQAHTKDRAIIFAESGIVLRICALSVALIFGEQEDVFIYLMSDFWWQV